VKAAAARWREALQRLLPFLVAVSVAACGYLWLIQPRLGVYLRARSDAVMLRDRVRTLQASAARVLPQSPSNTQVALGEFERHVASQDRVTEVAAALAKAVLDSAPADRLRTFTIETGDRVQQGADSGGRGSAQAGDPTGGDGPDPRFGLFPYGVSYTPIRISFESTFEAAADFLWKILDLPTVVEIQSVRLTRGLPLMKAEVVIRVYQRGDAADAGQAAAPARVPPGPGGPTAPRLAVTAGSKG
jgi:Tfp pilus assembly protein PilO